MFSLPLDWLALVSLLRSDRWLSVYLRGPGAKSKAPLAVAQAALFDLQHYQEHAFRQDDVLAAVSDLGGGNLPFDFDPMLRAAKSLLAKPKGKAVVVNDQYRELWSALIAKVDPAWFIGIRLAETIQPNDDIEALLKRQVCASALLESDHDNASWADNHVHIGGLYGPGLALLDITTELDTSVVQGAWPRMPEFPMCSEGEPSFSQLPVLVNNLFFFLSNRVFGIGKEHIAPYWEANVTWLPVSQSVLRARIVKPETSAQELLQAAFNGQFSPQQRWLALVTGLLLYERTIKAPADWRWALRAFMHACNILRSAMIGAGTGLGSFRDFFGSSLRKGRDKQAYLEVGVDHGFAPGVDANLRLNMAMPEVTRIARRLYQSQRKGDTHLALHFSRSERRNTLGKREKLHRQLLDTIAELQKTLWAWSGRRHPIETLDSSTDYVDLARLVRILDVAGEETAGPIELFAPVIRVLREMSGSQPGVKAWTLSIHAGEDFDHPVSGLRAIEETVYFCGMTKGDRLGHALALGIDVRAWMGRQVRCFLTVGGYLDNLVFLYFKAQEIQKKHPEVVLAWTLSDLYTEVKKWSAILYGHVQEPQTLVDAWRFRRNCYFKAQDLPACALDLGKVWVPDADTFSRQPESDAVKLWRRYHSLEDFKEKDRRVLVVSPGQQELSCGQYEVVVLSEYEIALVEQVQDFMMQELAESIAIEACPTSNIYVGRLKQIAEHPVFRWDPPDSAEIQHEAKFNRHALRSSAMRVCLNTDDPGLMPTSISHEHWLMQGAAPSGLGDEVLETWKERLRQCGRDLFDEAHQQWHPSDEKLLAQMESVFAPPEPHPNVSEFGG